MSRDVYDVVVRCHLISTVSFSASLRSGFRDADPFRGGGLQNGYPQCQSAAGLFLCNPCSRRAGEEQILPASSLTRNLWDWSLARLAQRDALRVLTVVTVLKDAGLLNRHVQRV